ncbi:MAG: CHAT domain-containing protein [Bacteroidetes bacterium]|nr:CHAT domain-containing protein [Bacteroidota bacterium]
MRITVTILVCLLFLPLSAQKWERLDQKFSQHFADEEYVGALKDAVKEVNYSVKKLDSTDIRYMHSYYNLARAYFSLDEPELAKSYVGIAYALMVPYYQRGADLGDVCELYGRIETELGFHETAASLLSYARDVKAEVYGTRSYEYLQSLYYIADLEMARSEWQQMVDVLAEALAIHEQHFLKNHEYARYANFLGLIYMNNGFNGEATDIFKRALSAYDQTGIEKDFPFGHANNNLALAYYYQSDFRHAAIHFERADSIYLILMEGYSENYMMLLNNLASLYYSWGKPELARGAYLELEQYLEKYPGHSDLNYIQGVENAANYYAEIGEAGNAEKYYIKAIELRHSATPVDHEELAGGILLLAYLYREEGKNELSAETAVEAYKILSKIRPAGDPDLLWVLSFLGEAYFNLHQDQRSMYYYQLAKELIEGTEGVDSLEALPVYNQLGILYHRQKRLSDAVQCLERAHELNPAEPATMINLGMVYYDMGNATEARELHAGAKKIYGERYGTDSPDYGNALIHEIGFKTDFRDFNDDMLEEIREVERICLDGRVDSTSRLFIDCLGAYRSYYFGIKEYHQSVAYGERTLGLVGMSYGKDSRFYAENMLVLADSYVMLGDTENLGLLYEKAYGIAEGLDSLNREILLYIIESGRFNDYYYLEDYQTSRESIEWVIERDKRQFMEMQKIMTLKERAVYSGIQDNISFYNNFLLHFPEDSEVIIRALNYRLFYKGLLMESDRRQREALSQTGDSSIIRMHDEYLQAKNRLANMRSEFGVDVELLDSIESGILQLEREISRQVGEVMALENRSFTWKEIQAVLGEDEAAVEVLQFNPIHQPGYWYVAFIITRESGDFPLCIMNPMEDPKGGEYIDYRTFMESESPGKLSDNLWVRMDEALKGKGTIYFSPDGKYHKLNLESFTDHNGNFAINTYKFNYVNSLKELLLPEIDYSQNRSAMLAGDPSFRMSLASVPDPVPGESSRSVSDFQSRMFPGTHLSELPGTRTEVDSIGSMFESLDWDCISLTGQEASEDVISKVNNPRVLHLATHGYFAKDKKQEPDNGSFDQNSRSYTFDLDTYTKSCLFFSGAQSTLFYAYDYQEGSGDGILTAWEIMEMNLDSTELVVLSACDSGLGEVLASGGVYGLRRAFHLAGAQRVLISLWKVDDQATQLLMRKFYSNWLSGMQMDESLISAKLYLMNETEFNHPRYWAAFILSGI